jgi:hypothetical protein
LIWVLRDFSLDKGDKSPKEYLELCLKNVEDTNEGMAGKNSCRDIIKRHFKKRNCYTLVIPTTDDQKIKNLETESKLALRPEFLKQVDDMIALIKSSITEKKINNISLDGEAVFSLLQSKFFITQTMSNHLTMEKTQLYSLHLKMFFFQRQKISLRNTLKFSKRTLT